MQTAKKGYHISNQSAPHFLTFTINGWIDLFTRQCYRDIILENLNYCRVHKALKLHAYVIMSNHLHLIWSHAKKDLSGLIRDFKSFTSKSLSNAVETQPESRKEWLLYLFHYHKKGNEVTDKYSIWTADNHPEEIYSCNFFHSKLNYIHLNPVRAGLVKKPGDFIYSRASYYEGRKGLIDIDPIVF